ncbi:hypothetical protein GCM10023201_36280 [Actinomycetospora corticicola]|uniref:Uncharacterized protein n=1 Tax=Actinomycetospora corticicola TaxID=663602 RepID=A0A7Y9DZ66_9PSEU|nr:hypothetical protein [Actinomycetospora corticicola]NYD38269.1 hypothetical protein [Actinomycetospora corticicola]
MWVWRDETVRGGWRLDNTGSWRYDEPARLEPVGAPRRVEPDARAREQWARERFLADQRARQERLRPALAATPGDPFEAEPIFRSVAHEVREERRYEGGRYRHAAHAPAERHGYIPEPHPGSGPFPAQDGGRRRLAPVDEVPPPPVAPVPPVAPDLGPVASAEEELRRRAERRRRPHAEPAGGRHVLRH